MAEFYGNLPGINFIRLGDLLGILAPECFTAVPLSEVRVGDMVVGGDPWENAVVGHIEEADEAGDIDLLDTHGNNGIGECTKTEDGWSVTILRRDLLAEGLQEAAAREYLRIREERDDE